MKNNAFAVDLHIHSCLSPCADEDMTPNNIVNMAKLKGLDFIAVADHNSGANLPALAKAALRAGIGFIPAIEVNTKEEIHVLAYLPDLERAMELDGIIMESMPDIPNREDFFGRQVIMDADDESTGKVDRLLISASAYSMLELKRLVEGMDGAILPAHIDRKSFSLISNLGFIPTDLGIGSVELSAKYAQGEDPFLDKMVEGMRIFRSSDAHYLHQILERVYFVHLDDKSPRGIIDKIRGN